jgi:ABC-2 type transport system permease protein
MGGLHSIGVTLAVAFAVLIGSYVYVAIFVALSVVTSRGLIIGLAYSLIWEGLLAGILPGSQIFSVREYLGGIASVLASQAVRDSLVGAGGFLYAGVTFGVALLVASARLATYEIRGSD